MPDTPVPAAATGLPRTINHGALPDAHLAALLGDNISRWFAADRAGDVHLEKAISEHRFDLEAQSSWMHCADAAAALAKLVIMEAEVDVALSNLEDVERYSIASRCLSRQIGSLIRWIEQTHNIRREDFRLDFYHTDINERRAWGLPRDGEGAIPGAVEPKRAAA